jgi:hypothetical protein
MSQTRGPHVWKKRKNRRRAVDSVRRLFGFNAKVRSQPEPRYADGNVRSDPRRFKEICTAMLIKVFLDKEPGHCQSYKNGAQICGHCPSTNFEKSGPIRSTIFFVAAMNCTRLAQKEMRPVILPDSCQIGHKLSAVKRCDSIDGTSFAAIFSTVACRS